MKSDKSKQRGWLRSQIAVVTLATGALVMGAVASGVAGAAPQDLPTASSNKDWSVPRTATPSAVPGVPDVGLPGEEAVGPVGMTTIDPYGHEVSSTTGARKGQISVAAIRWTWVTAVVDGARLRSRPVNGAVLRLIPYRTSYLIGCKQRAADGYVWGYASYASYAGAYGWVRGDLWAVQQFTAPGAPPNGPVPWC